MPVPVLPIHILSMLSVIHTVRGESALLAERLPHWQKGLSYPGVWKPTARQLRRWRLLYTYWQNEQEMLLKRGIRRQHLDEDLARQLRELTAALAPPASPLEVVLPDPHIWACIETPFPWREQHGLVEPVILQNLAMEARIPAFELSTNHLEPGLANICNRAVMTLGVCLGQFLDLDERCPLSVNAKMTADLRLRDESIGLPLVLAVLKDLSQLDRVGLAAAGVLDGEGRLQAVTGFDHPYGKLEACFDEGLQKLYVPWGTRLYDLPKAGINLEEHSKGHYSYYLEDQPEDRLQIYWLKDLKGAIQMLWGEQAEDIADELRARLAAPQESPFEHWEALYHRIEAGYPDWLAVSFKIYFELFREMSQQGSALLDWQDLMRQQARWVHLWLRYLLVMQASGLWLARQPLEELWPAFPACCQPDASLYLLWQALQQLCQLEQRGPLPFRHLHQWLCQHQTGWGMLLNQLIQLENAAETEQIQESMRYNMQRLMELLKSAEFMFNYPLYGVLEAKGEETLGVQYRGQACRGMLSGGLPVSNGGLFIEDPRTRTRFQLPFLRLCPECSALEQFAPLALVGRSPEHGLRFEGCDHAPVYFNEDSFPALTGTGLSSAYGWSNQPWVTARRRVTEPDTAGAEKPVMACVLHSEMIVDAFTTLQDPQLVVSTYERIMHELMGWMKLNPKDAEDLIVSFGEQSVALVFLRHPEAALAFALGLHQLVTDYNGRQTMPSAHLQIRTGLDLGCVWLGPGQGRVNGQPLQRSLWLARMGEPGQLLASDSVRQALARVSSAHRQLFQLVGRTSDDARSEAVYTLYTRTTGLRKVPARLSQKTRGPLPASQLETMPLARREATLIWLSVLGIELPDLSWQTAEVAQTWISELETRLFELARPLDSEPVLVPYEQGLLLVFDQPVDGAFALGVALLSSLRQRPASWQVQLAVHIGLGELKPRHDSHFGLVGPLRSRLQQLLELSQIGHLLCDGPSQMVLHEIDPDLTEQFSPCESPELDFTVYSYTHDGAAPIQLKQPEPMTPEALAPSLQQVFDPAARLPLAAVLTQAKKLAKNRLENLLADRFGDHLHAMGPPRMIQNHLGMLFQHIKPGHFTMGSPLGEPGRTEDERSHLVVLTRPFYLLTTTVNQKQWEQIMGKNPAFFKHPDLPVESVSWNDVAAFLARLNALGKERYRLPTEAEWEYCCRAGSKKAFCFGSDSNGLRDYAWYQTNSDEGYAVKQPHPVATRHPNAWGLYDLHGNVWEWVQDWFDDLPTKAVTNPTGPESGDVRVIRGGRWNSPATSCRSASRSFLPPHQANPGSLGFRLVMES